MRVLASLAAFLLIAPFAFGETESGQISYEDALRNCEEFVNDPQIVSIEFKVSCFDADLKWEQTGMSRVTSPNERSVGHRLMMKEKWNTPDFLIPMVVTPVESECPVLTQFKTTRQKDIVLTCEEFVNEYQNPEDLIARCDQAVAEASPQKVPTGHELNLCNGSIVQ